MKELRIKLKKMKPLIKSKQAEFEKEMSSLAQIKDLKLEALQHLRQNQDKYIKGVDQVNTERLRGNFSTASVLEPALEYIKKKWHESLREVQRIEKDQEIQTGKVLQVQQELKSIEALEEKYHHKLAKVTKSEEQKALDEMSIMLKRRE